MATPSPSSAASSSPPSEIRIRVRQQEPAEEHDLTVSSDIEVTALKATIEEASGVPASRQRLICRGRVLKDTQRLSELRVEDGDTLHMVQRPPDVPGNPLNDDPTHAAQQQRGAGGGGGGGGGGGVNVVQMGSISVPTSALGAQQISQIMSGLLGSAAAASGPGGGAMNADDFAAAAAAAGITPDGEETIQFTHHHHPTRVQ